MKIAIHDSGGGYSEGWLAFCKEKNIPHKVINCYDNNIIQQVSDCDALLWHHHHVNYKDNLFAKQLLYSLQQAGKRVYPDFNTNWHFDDKLGQKYLMEAVGVPLVTSYAFYTRKEAMDWINSTSYPKVFKLRGGAGASNVMLVRNKKTAARLVNKAFGSGFSTFNRSRYLRDRWRKMREGNDSFVGVLKGLGRLVVSTEFAKMTGREKGYVYFQDFIENEGYDIRVVVIGKKAAALKRLVRKNDFRASGSKNIVFENEKIDKNYIRAAFEVAHKLKSQSLSIDFIRSTKTDKIYLVEISYASPARNISRTSGYWNDQLEWVNAPFNPSALILEQLLMDINS